MKFGVVIFPGSNCDQDLIKVLETYSSEPVLKLWHKDKDLQGCTHIFVPGGFSYGDYLRSGAIAKLSPIMTAVAEHAKAGGFVIGICNGFQILCESGLLPGALLRNTNMKFNCKMSTYGLEIPTWSQPVRLEKTMFYVFPLPTERVVFIVTIKPWPTSKQTDKCSSVIAMNKVT